MQLGCLREHNSSFWKSFLGSAGCFCGFFLLFSGSPSTHIPVHNVFSIWFCFEAQCCTYPLFQRPHPRRQVVSMSANSPQARPWVLVPPPLGQACTTRDLNSCGRRLTTAVPMVSSFFSRKWCISSGPWDSRRRRAIPRQCWMTAPGSCTKAPRAVGAPDSRDLTSQVRHYAFFQFASLYMQSLTPRFFLKLSDWPVLVFDGSGAPVCKGLGTHTHHRHDDNNHTEARLFVHEDGILTFFLGLFRPLCLL